MARQLRAEDVANIMDEADWDDSDASSDEDDDCSPLGLRDPLQRAEDSEDSDNDSGHTEKTVHAGALPPQDSEQPHTSDPTFSTGSLPTLPVTFNEPVGLAIDMDSTATTINILPLHLAMT